MSTMMKRSRAHDGADLEPTFSIVPIEDDARHPAHGQAMLDLQLKMATNSINHEYARLEFDQEGSSQRREELLEYMQDCREQYFHARAELAAYDPSALAEFEQDLWRQKTTTLACYNA